MTRALAAALGVALATLGAAAAAPVVEEAPKPGYQAPRFKALDLEGRPAGTAAFKGRVLLINFWASWCAPCVDEMPALDRLQAALPATAFTIVALSQDVDAGDVRKFLKAHPVRFPVAIDDDAAVARQYKVRGLPATFLVDKDGRIVERIVGPRPWDDAAWIEKIRALTQK